MDRQLLHNTLSVQSKSGDTGMMDRYLLRFFRRYQMDHPDTKMHVVQDNGNIYVKKGVAEVYPCVIAHTDTVHKIIDNFVVKVHNGVYYGVDRDTQEQAGVGGDDKVGIAIALAAFQTFDVIKLAFFRDEEVGCVGSRRALMHFFDDCAFVLQADRKGNTDVVHTVMGVPLFDEVFGVALAPFMDDHEFRSVEGMMTDVYMLRRMGMPIASFNVAAGYWNPHTSKETVVYADVEKTWSFMRSVITELGDRQWPCERRVHSFFSLFEEEEEEEDEDDIDEILSEFDDDDTAFEAQRFAYFCTSCDSTNITYDDSMGMNYCWSCAEYFWVESGVRV